MPYVIETRQPCAYCTHCGYSRREGSSECLHARESRVAVATLDKARQAATEACILRETQSPNLSGGWDVDYAPFEAQCEALPGSGGTIGPLPDGTTIEVRPVDNSQLGSMAGRVWHEDDDPMPDERYPHELRDY